VALGYLHHRTVSDVGRMMRSETYFRRHDWENLTREDFDRRR
jgi:hypothetical protein